MRQGLMLDVDGVLVTGRREDGRSWAADIKRDLGVDPAKLRDVFFVPHWSAIVTGQKPLFQVLEACLPEIAGSVTAQTFIDYWFEQDSRVDPDVLAACAELRRQGVSIFLATNQEHLRAAYLMETLKLRDHVDGMIYSAGIGARKPEPAFFDAATKASGFAPDALVLVDDTHDNVVAARQAGWSAVHWTGDDRLTDLFGETTTG